MAIDSGNFAKLLYPGLNAIYGNEYKEFPVEYTDLFDTFKSTRAYEEDIGVVGLGLAQQKPEGQAVSFDEEEQAFITRYSHLVWALGFIITREMYEDDQYGYIGKRKAGALAFSARQTKEIVGANVYNRAFNSSYTGGDGVSLVSASHPNWSGGTWSNQPSVASDLTEAALEQAMIDIGKWTNDRGLRIAVQAKTLHIPVDLQYDAERLLMTPYRVGTADNDINTIKGMFPGGAKVNHYFTDTNAWFIRTNIKDGMKYFQRRPMEFTIDNDFDTENAKYKYTERYSVGWTDPRAVYGSAGA
jgi:phage major head subunit gpT-like protein